MTPELHRPWFSHYEPSVPRTVTVFDQPLYSLLDEAAARYPKRPALIFQNTRLSYKALHEAAERFAGALRRAGIEYAAAQLRGLRDAGADGLHVYTMNKPAVARAICELL